MIDETDAGADKLEFKANGSAVKLSFQGFVLVSQTVFQGFVLWQSNKDSRLFAGYRVGLHAMQTSSSNKGISTFAVNLDSKCYAYMLVESRRNSRPQVGSMICCSQPVCAIKFRTICLCNQTQNQGYIGTVKHQKLKVIAVQCYFQAICWCSQIGIQGHMPHYQK
jgi:hypothetical protein